jgi:adenosylcobyric acid synthase
MSGRQVPLVVWGTGPGSGKTHTCVGITRSLVRRGLPTTPFKAVTVVSAGSGSVPIPFHLAAARLRWLEWTAPVVVRPDSGGTGALEVAGRWLCRVGLVGADTLDLAGLAPAHRQQVIAAVDGALDRLRADHPGVLLIEGAGSPVDAAVDLANLHVLRRLATAQGLPPRVLLSAYAHNGGSPAALVGTYRLLPEDLQPYVGGYLLNSPRPDAPVARWERQIHRATGLPLLGVLPRLPAYEHLARTQPLDRLADIWADAVSAALDLDSLVGRDLDPLGC